MAGFAESWRREQLTSVNGDRRRETLRGRLWRALLLELLFSRLGCRIMPERRLRDMGNAAGSTLLRCGGLRRCGRLRV